MPDLPGWGPLKDPEPTPAPAAPEWTGELDAELLVDAITSNPDALELLAKALAPKTEDETKLRTFATTAEWVEEYLIPTWRVQLESNEVKWCEWWWKHPSARHELTMLWESWESHKRVPSSMADWLVLRFFPVWDRLLTPRTSPFRGCQHRCEGHDEATHNPSTERLPLELPPDDLFPVWPTKANPKP